MALWRYCEQSAKWIFGTSTGNRNADKILQALRHADAGMTKTEISIEVFNRHASSAEIDEALRLLHGLHMVGYRTEATGGAPLQRWFFAAKPAKKANKGANLQLISLNSRVGRLTLGTQGCAVVIKEQVGGETSFLPSGRKGIF